MVTSENTPVGGPPARSPQAPEWAHRLLTSYLNGLPLDFRGLRLPPDIKARLDNAYDSGVLKGGVPRRVQDVLIQANHKLRGPVEETPRHCWKSGPHMCGDIWTDHNYVSEQL